MIEVLRLGEFAEVSAGNSAPQNNALFKDGTLPFIRTSDVGAIHIGSIQSSRDLLTPEGAKGLKLFPAGTILFPKSGASTFLNHRVILNASAYVSSHLATIKAKNDVALDSYIFYFLQTIDARDLCQDQSYPSLNRNQIAGVEVPLPPLDEQQRIVEKLDIAFAEINLLEEKLQFIDGKANELFQSLQSEAFTSIENEWQPIRLGELGKWITGSTPSTTNKKFWGNEVPFVTPADLSASGELGKIGRQISKLGSEQVRLITAPSVLLVCIGATLGKVAWTNQTITTNQQINALQVDGNKVNTKFVMYLLSSPSVQKKLWNASTGTTVPILNKGNLESIVVSIPSLEKQNEIVEKLDRLFMEIELLRKQFEFEKDKVSTLRQSLLRNTFNLEEAVA